VSGTLSRLRRAKTVERIDDLFRMDTLGGQRHIALDGGREDQEWGGELIWALFVNTGPIILYDYRCFLWNSFLNSGLLDHLLNNKVQFEFMKLIKLQRFNAVLLRDTFDPQDDPDKWP